MVKALSFKGDKKPAKKRKRATDEEESSSKSLVPSTSEPAADEDENWVSADSITDVSGPILIVLPSTHPTSCIAADSLGKVFTSTIENMVEGEARSAEPHDVRQVWIAQGIVGMEGKFTFKAHSGRYLGCDEVGQLSAAREAVSQEETWRVQEKEGGGGTFELITGRGKRVGAEDGSGKLRGDVEEDGEGTEVIIRMQARFKPKHKVEKAEKVRAKISRKELEDEVGRRLEDDEVKKLKKARREGNYHEAMLDVKVKGKHDKFA